MNPLLATVLANPEALAHHAKVMKLDDADILDCRRILGEMTPEEVAEVGLFIRTLEAFSRRTGDAQTAFIMRLAHQGFNARMHELTLRAANQPINAKGTPCTD